MSATAGKGRRDEGGEGGGRGWATETEDRRNTYSSSGGRAVSSLVAFNNRTTEGVLRLALIFRLAC